MLIVQRSISMVNLSFFELIKFSKHFSKRIIFSMILRISPTTIITSQRLNIISHDFLFIFNKRSFGYEWLVSASIRWFIIFKFFWAHNVTLSLLQLIMNIQSYIIKLLKCICRRFHDIFKIFNCLRCIWKHWFLNIH